MHSEVGKEYKHLEEVQMDIRVLPLKTIKNVYITRISNYISKY
jgi:hypothetical protein